MNHEVASSIPIAFMSLWNTLYAKPLRGKLLLIRGGPVWLQIKLHVDVIDRRKTYNNGLHQVTNLLQLFKAINIVIQ